MIIFNKKNFEKVLITTFFLLPIGSMGNDLTEYVKKCDLNRTKLLVEKIKLDVNKANRNGVTPLHFASSLSDKNCHADKIMEFLIKKGANLNAQTVDGYTPLQITAYNGYYRLSKILIENGADINIKNNDKSTALHQLLKSKNIEDNHIKLLIEKGADVNVKDKYNITPIHLTVGTLNSKGDTLELNYLISKKSKINEKTVDGITPLEIAIRKSNKSIKYIPYVKILIENGATIDTKYLTIAKNKKVKDLLIKQPK
jgi:ankyrin repeat protein